MFSILSLIKKIGSLVPIILLVGCTHNLTSNDANEALINANRGARSIIQIDYKVYMQATSSELTPVTKELLRSSLSKVAVLRGFEKDIGGNFKIEDGLTTNELNELCWMGNFLQKYKVYIPSQIDKSDSYSWIDAKQKSWKARIQEINGDKMIKDDCRIIN